MGVYIKGMEMPKSCQSCFANEYQTCIFTGKNASVNGKLPDCHLVPVPPHGRLIDADAYEKLLRGLGNRDYRREAGTLQDAIKFLHPHYAPTIIPAEEGE